MAGLTRRWWTVVDAALKKMGLMRRSQQPIKTFEFRRSLYCPDYLSVEFSHGLRVGGYIARCSKPVSMSANPLLGSPR